MVVKNRFVYITIWGKSDHGSRYTLPTILLVGGGGKDLALPH